MFDIYYVILLFNIGILFIDIVYNVNHWTLFHCHIAFNSVLYCQFSYSQSSTKQCNATIFTTYASRLGKFVLFKYFLIASYAIE